MSFHQTAQHPGLSPIRLVLSRRGSEAWGTYHGDNAFLPLLLLAHHGVGLPRPRLAVGEDADVVALEGVLQHLLPDVIVHEVL